LKELDINGRSLNRPIPIMVIQISVCEGRSLQAS
jgi:hypothetical protein